LVQSFLKKFGKNMNSNISSMTPEAMNSLRAYRWPGNIRELENAIERAFIVETGTSIRPESLPENIRHYHAPEEQKSTLLGKGASHDYESFKEKAEREFIVSALRANNGRINQTVARANIPKNTLLRKIKKYGINVKDLGEE